MKVDRPSTPIISQKGFTIIELMIATLVFSVILLLVTYGLIQIGRTYIKGLNESKTQQTARSIMDTISQDIQFNGGKIKIPAAFTGTFAVCIGDNRYSAMIDGQLVDGVPDTVKHQTNHTLVVDRPVGGECNATPLTYRNLNAAIPPDDPYKPRELMAPNMRLAKFNITPAGALLWNIKVRVVYGDDDLLNPARDACAGGPGSQFCAVAELSTTVQKRVR